MRKVLILFLSVFIAFSPLLTLGNFSFAEDTPSSGGGAWTHPTTHDEVVAAFKAYCKSRNFQYLHSNKVLQAIVAWDYDQFEKNCALLNIDPEGLNAEIWYSYTKSPKYLKWFFNKTAMAKFNQIYGSILAEYNMQYDVPEKKQIYSGKYYVTDTGVGVYTFVLNTNSGSSSYFNQATFNERVVGIGSIYLTTGRKVFAELSNGEVLPIVVKDNNVNYGYNLVVMQNVNYVGHNAVKAYGLTENIPTTLGGNPVKTIYYTSKYYETLDGYPCIIFFTNNSQYWLGVYNSFKEISSGDMYYCVNPMVQIGSTNVTDSNIEADQGDSVAPVTNKSLTIITDVDTVNNYITNDSHDTYNYGDDDEPDDGPKQKPVPPDSITPNPNNPSLPTGDPDFNFQMPNVNIDWDLDLDFDNLPFPFSIPHDMIRFLTILDSQPEAPKYEIQTEVFDTPIDLEIDLSVFDDGMVIIRNIILAGYCVFLIISTRALFHIY